MDLLDLKDLDPDFEVSEKGSTLSVGQNKDYQLQEHHIQTENHYFRRTNF